MHQTIEVTKKVYSRLEKHAVGFGDDPSSVINRLLDSFERIEPEIKDPQPTRPYIVTARGKEHRLFNNKEIQQRISSIAESITAHELESLCNENKSKEIFGISFPLFIKVPSTANELTKKQAVKSNDGVNRWTWKFAFVRNGFSYAICTQWYPKHDPFVQQWVNAHE